MWGENLEENIFSEDQNVGIKFGRKYIQFKRSFKTIKLKYRCILVCQRR